MVMRVPTYSKLASFVAIWSFSTILTCIILMIITSRPSYRTEGELQEKVVAFWISFGLQVSFMTEMLLNWLSMKSLSEFFGFFNILDMVTILPFWIIFFVHLGQGVNPTGSEAGGLSLLRVLRLLRLTKVFKTRRSARIVLLAQAVKESTFGILALLVVFPLVAIFYGTFVYYVETASCIVDPTNGEWIYNVYPNTGTVSKFQSIDISLWFMTVTLTTVGYGDVSFVLGWKFLKKSDVFANPPSALPSPQMVPLTPQGRFVACIAMVTALFLLAMPMTIITSSYGRVLDRFNAQTDQIKALKFRIRQIEWHICKLENRVYVDPFKIVRPGPSKVRQWFESFKVFFFGEKEKKPSKPPTGVSLTTGEPDAADLVDADAEKEGLEGDPDVEGGNNVDEMVRDLKSLVETKAKTDSDTRDRIVKLEENVAKMLSLLEKLDAAMPAA